MGPSAREADTLVAAIVTQPDQLDPHQTTSYPSFQVLENVYDTLVVPDADLRGFAPSLATRWKTSPDGRIWTFNLRRGVTFHDGSRFDAADVVYSFNRIIDEELANAFRFENVGRVVAADPWTVELHLTQPEPNLLANVGGFKGMAILPEGADRERNLDRAAVGTGPFRLRAIKPDRIELAANPDYWGKGPRVDAVEFRFIPESTTALTELRVGEVDWTDNIPPHQVDELGRDSRVVLESLPSVDYWYMATNFKRRPFGDARVRRALSLAIDRKLITRAAKYDAATPTQTAIPDTSFWSIPYSPYRHDPQRARQLLRAAGADNVRMGLMVTDEFPETVQAAQVIASQLDEVGITVNIQSVEFSVWLTRSGEGDFDALMLGWLGNIDPFDYYNSQHLCDGANNVQGYCNPRTDRLLTAGANEADQRRRRQLYAQAARQIVDDNSYLYLYNPDVTQAWTPKLSGYQVRADKAINFERVRLTE